MVTRNIHDVRFTNRLVIGTGFERVAALFSDLGPRLMDITPIAGELHALAQSWVRDNFASQGATVGAAWRPDKPATIKRKAREGYGSTPGVRTGALRQAVDAIDLLRQSERSVTSGLRRQPDSTVAAAFHFGGGRSGNNPPRRFFEPSRAQEAQAKALVEAHVERIINSARVPA